MENLSEQFRQLRTAIDLCIAAHLVTPSLILIYSAIDIAAWLTFGDAEPVGTRFRKWCETYLLPGSGITATPDDLYGARCGLVHSLSPDSRLSKSGRARMVVYAWGNSDHTVLEKMIDLGKMDAYVTVRLESLATALFSAFDRLIKEPASDFDETALQKRANSLFTAMSKEEANDLLSRAKRLLRDD